MARIEIQYVNRMWQQYGKYRLHILNRWRGRLAERIYPAKIITYFWGQEKLEIIESRLINWFKDFALEKDVLM